LFVSTGMERTTQANSASYLQWDWKWASAKAQWQRSAAGKITVGLALHWPRVTESVVYPHVWAQRPKEERSASHLPPMEVRHPLSLILTLLNYVLETMTELRDCVIKPTRHRASRSMYSLTFCVRFLLPEHCLRSNVENIPLSTANQRWASHAHFPYTACNFENAPRHPSVSSQQPAARAEPAQPAVCTMSSYREMDASL